MKELRTEFSDGDHLSDIVQKMEAADESLPIASHFNNEFMYTACDHARLAFIAGVDDRSLTNNPSNLRKPDSVD